MIDIIEFAAQIEEDVSSEQGQGGDSDRERVFTRVLMEDLVAAGALDAPIECRYEVSHLGKEVKVNGYEIQEDDGRLDLIVAEYRAPSRGEPARLNSSDLEKLFRSAERLLEYVVSGRPSGMGQVTQASEMFRVISRNKDEIRKVQITLITNCVIATRITRVTRKQLCGYPVQHETWDLERLRRFRAGGASHEPIAVDLSRLPGGGLACLSTNDPALGYGTSIAIIPGVMLADWYEEYGPRLLELNVRAYLQAKGKINKGILETLQKTPERFLAYNNGITIVAEDVAFTSSQERIQKISGMQIVNGGQTTASIHRARRELRADLSHVWVQAKITKVLPEDFQEVVPEISRLSNTQNKVSAVDLGANHPFHVGLERAALKRWTPDQKSKWFYERARGSYQTERSRRGRTKSLRDQFDKEYPPNQKLSKEDIARCINAYDGYPHFVSKGGQKNFVHFMTTLPSVQKDWEPTAREFQEVIAKAIIFKHAIKIAQWLGISGYRINIAAYTVALMAWKSNYAINLKRIWEMQDITPAMQAQITDWLPKVSEVLARTSTKQNVTDWYKLESCWQRLKESSDSLPLLPEFLEEAGGAAPLSGRGAASPEVGRCKGLDAESWLRIYQWAEQDGRFTRQQLDIASRMTQLAVRNWDKDPTQRQAVEAATLIEAYDTRED